MPNRLAIEYLSGKRTCYDTYYSIFAQLKYLGDYARKLELNIQYETEIVDISRLVDGGTNFHLTDQNGDVHQCRVLIVR